MRSSRIRRSSTLPIHAGWNAVTRENTTRTRQRPQAGLRRTGPPLYPESPLRRAVMARVPCFGSRFERRANTWLSNEDAQPPICHNRAVPVATPIGGVHNVPH